jgi:hypothetical protein
MADPPFNPMDLGSLYSVDPNDPEPLTDLIPPKIMLLAWHLHNLIYIRFFYEQIGMQPPEWTKGEMQRSQTHLLHQLDLESGQGGRFRKEIRDEARQSGQEREGVVEDRTHLPQGGYRRRF